MATVAADAVRRGAGWWMRRARVVRHTLRGAVDLRTRQAAQALPPPSGVAQWLKGDSSPAIEPSRRSTSLRPEALEFFCRRQVSFTGRYIHE